MKTVSVFFNFSDPHASDHGNHAYEHPNSSGDKNVLGHDVDHLGGDLCLNPG